MTFDLHHSDELSLAEAARTSATLPLNPHSRLRFSTFSTGPILIACSVLVTVGAAVFVGRIRSYISVRTRGYSAILTVDDHDDGMHFAI